MTLTRSLRLRHSTSAAHHPKHQPYNQTHPLSTASPVASSETSSDFGDPDHLALIRLDGLVLMKLVAILARREHRTEIRLPNFVLDFRDLTTRTLTLQEQIDFLNQYISLVNLTRPPLRTYDEIVALAPTPWEPLDCTKNFLPTPCKSLDKRIS